MDIPRYANVGKDCESAQQAAIRRRRDQEQILMRKTVRQTVCDGWKILKSDIYETRAVILILALYFLFFRYVLHSICPVVLVTGYPCPGCGMTRAAFCVLRMDFESAWETHPFIFPIILLAAVFCWNRYVRGREKQPALRAWAAAVGIAMILFYIWRMYEFFPGEPPMSYYSGNLMSRIKSVLLHLR